MSVTNGKSVEDITSMFENNILKNVKNTSQKMFGAKDNAKENTNNI